MALLLDNTDYSSEDDLAVADVVLNIHQDTQKLHFPGKVVDNKHVTRVKTGAQMSHGRPCWLLSSWPPA